MSPSTSQSSSTVDDNPPADDGGSSQMAASMAAVESLLGYSFQNRRLLAEALTHPSLPLPSGATYERLEHLGDAALGLAVTTFLFCTNPLVGPGTLSELRSANISTEKLARAALRHGLYPLLRRSSSSLDGMVRDFALAVQAEDEGDPAAAFGGSTLRAPKVLADVVEAIAGAVYTDKDFDPKEMWHVVGGLLAPIVTVESMQDQPVATLHELCQKLGKAVEFVDWAREGKWVANVFVAGKLVGIGSSEQKSIAKLNAARDALRELRAVIETEAAVGGMDPLQQRSNGDGVGRDLLQQWSAEDGGGRDGKRRLNELCSRNHWPMPIYKINSEEGPSHEKRFQCSVRVETLKGISPISGDFKSKVKDAENDAACKLFNICLQLLGRGKI